MSVSPLAAIREYH